MDAAVLAPVPTSSWNAVRALLIALIFVALLSAAFVIGRATTSSSTRTVTVTRVVPAAVEPCTPAHHGPC